MHPSILDDNNHLAYTESNRRSRRLGAAPRADGLFINWAHFLIFIGLIFLTSTCSSAPYSPQQTKKPSPTEPILRSIPEPSPTPDATKIPTFTATAHVLYPTKPDCTDKQGMMIISELDILSVPNKLPFRLYLPPCYAEDTEMRYPTLYLLHGLAADDSQWDKLGADESADALIASGELPPTIIVMPWHRTGVDLEMAVVNILVPHIDNAFRTIAEPEWRAIGGVSRGGGWALRIGLKHPDLFNTIGLHSPANFLSDFYITTLVENISNDEIPRLWIDIGERDSLLDSTNQLISLLNALGVSVSSEISSGGHDAGYWSAHLDTYLLWYTSSWLDNPVR